MSEVDLSVSPETQKTRDFLKRYPNFTWDEMRCPCEHHDCPEVPIADPEFKSFMDMLQELRTALNFPFHMTSMYRCPAYNDMLYVRDFNAKSGEHRDGPHVHGAGDQIISFERMYQLVGSAIARGMGVGIKQHGPIDDRFIHLDNRGPRLWTY